MDRLGRRLLAAATIVCAPVGASVAAGAQLPPRGTVELHAIQDSTYHRERRVWVYTPPGYRAGTPYPLVVAFDGADYVAAIPLPRILDSLIAAHRVPPAVAVLVDDSSFAVRLQDLANRAPFARFLATQLIPWVRRGWSVTTDPARVVVTGSSAGGLGAAFVAFTHPELFGNVLSQSGAFWRGAEASNEPPYEWLTGQVDGSPRRPVRFLLDVGATEVRGALGGAAPSILVANRHLRDALRRKGYAVAYLEVPGGAHRPEDWVRRLPAALVELMGGW